MGYSSNNNDTGALYFGSANPVVTGQEVDNDSFIVTNDGTPTGTPVSFWKFDAETLTWVQVPSGGSTVTVVDNIDGTVTVNAGGANIQNAQRPILELPILARNLVDPSADYDDIWDASAGRMVRVLATRASQLSYKASGLNDTRLGDLGSINSSIYSVHDHIHPIIAITAPSQPVITVSGMTLAGTFLNATPVTEEESVTYEMTIQVTQPIANAWSFFTVPNIAGFKRPIVTITGTYRSSGNPNLSASWENAPVMGNECCNYVNSNTCYLNTSNRTQATTIYVSFSAKYVIL